MSASRQLPSRSINPALRGPHGEAPLLVDSLEVTSHEVVQLTFDSVGDRWRQGVFLATHGALAVSGVVAGAFTLWADSAPNPTEIEVLQTDGRLVLYNIWNSGAHGEGPESLSYTSGMLVSPLPDGSLQYRCNDVGFDSDFDSLVFRILIRAQRSGQEGR